MTGIFNRMRNAAEKRAAYRSTVAELRRLPNAVAMDLGIYPGDAERIAHETVYGR